MRVGEKRNGAKKKDKDSGDHSSQEINHIRAPIPSSGPLPTAEHLPEP